MKVFVTGIGAVTAIGDDCNENLSSLKSESTGISMDSSLEALTGKINLSDQELTKELDIDHDEYSRTTLLGLKASKEALFNLPSQYIKSLALISATTNGAIDKIEVDYFKSVQEGVQNNQEDAFAFDNGLTTDHIAKELGISGYINTISTACSSGANAIMLGARLINSGKYDRVLVGGVDPLTKYNICGFTSIGVYNKELCKPFDSDRNGMNLGEGAAFLLLENDKSINETGGSRISEITGWANTSDSFHQTASSEEGEGAQLSMKLAIEKANLKPSDINYISAHGTGTRNNDLSESRAIKAVFKNSIPPFSSTKCYTGHTLAAAGSVEAVFSVLSIKNNCLFSTNTFSSAMPETELEPVLKFSENQSIKHVLSNSFGFGGNCTSLIFSAC